MAYKVKPLRLEKDTPHIMRSDKAPPKFKARVVEPSDKQTDQSWMHAKEHTVRQPAGSGKQQRLKLSTHFALADRKYAPRLDTCPTCEICWVDALCEPTPLRFQEIGISLPPMRRLSHKSRGTRTRMMSGQ